MKKQAIDKMLNKSYDNIFKTPIYINNKQGVDGASIINAAIEAHPELGSVFTPYPDIDEGRNANLSDSFKMVAKVIADNETTNHELPSTVLLTYSGWDHYDDLLDLQMIQFSER